MMDADSQSQSVMPGTEPGFFRRNVDVFLGLAAWLVAMSDQIWPDFIYSLGVLSLFGVPIAWLTLNLLALRFRRRSAWRLWWIWTSAPVALTNLYIFVGWMF